MIDLIYVFLADGFEEIEAIATVDVLRRAELEVKTVGVGGKEITGSHGMKLTADICDCEVSTDDLQAIVLPGGMPGTLNLEKSDTVQKMIKHCADNSLLICAICAAPSILGHLGLLNGKTATCYPGFEEDLTGAELAKEFVYRDGNIITARGPGVTIDFAFKIAENFIKKEKTETIRRNMQCL